MPCDLCDRGDVGATVPSGRTTFPPLAGQGGLPAEVLFVQSAQASSTFLDRGWRGLPGLRPSRKLKELEESDCPSDLCPPIFYRKEGRRSHGR